MIPGLINRITGRSTYEKDPTPDDPFPNTKSIEDKIATIVNAKRREVWYEDIRRARLYYKIDLFFRGYQQLGPFNESSLVYPVYDDEPIDFQENQFRRDTLVLQGSLLKMRSKPIVRPQSGSFNDMSAAKAGEGAWDIIQDNIVIDQIQAEQCLYEVLFGNSYTYSDYQIDKSLGTILVPKFSYKNVELPGSAYCPQCGASDQLGTQTCPDCGMPMQQIEPQQTEAQTMTGMEQKSKGQEFSSVFSPLEVSCRSKVKGGLKNAPYLLRKSREDVDEVRYIYKGIKINGPRGGDSGYSSQTSSWETAGRYQDILAAVPGNIYGGANPYWGVTQHFNTVDVCCAWLQPQTFRGDKDLEKQGPNGIMAVVIDGETVEWRAENLLDHWVHRVGIRNPHSFLGDGLMFDAVSPQRMINQINQLQVRNFHYNTTPVRLFDGDLIVKEDISNDPGLSWIEVNTTPEKPLGSAVLPLPPSTLSMDIYQLKGQVYQGMRDVDGAIDPLAGKIAGANTPYSAQVQALEQGQVRFIGAMKYNAAADMDHCRQLLQIAQQNWIDPRTQAYIDDTIGKTTWSKFTGADLAQGAWCIKIATNDFKPKTRGDALAAFEQMGQFGINPTGSPKMRLDFFEKLGIDTEGDSLSTQAKRAYRMIDKAKNGIPISPDPIIDDGTIQCPILVDFLADEQGEQLADENPQAVQNIKLYWQSLQQMQAMKQNALGAMGVGAPPGPPPGGGPPPAGPPPPAPKGAPGGQLGQRPGGPRPGAPGELAQSPVPDANKQPMPPLPAGVR